MVFSNNFFLLAFFPLFFLAYYVAPNKLRNLVALAASIFFYAWGAPKFIFVLLFSLFIDFYLVRIINTSEGKLRKRILTLSVILNIGLLAYFKPNKTKKEENISVVDSIASAIMAYELPK